MLPVFRNQLVKTKKKKGVFLASKQSSEKILSSCKEIGVNNNPLCAFPQ